MPPWPFSIVKLTRVPGLIDLSLDPPLILTADLVLAEQRERLSNGQLTPGRLGVQPVEGPNYDALGGTVVVTHHGAAVAVLKPQKRSYWVQHQVTSETAIKMHHGSNVLLALGESLGAGRWSLRIQIRPLVSLIWLAAFIMAVGGALAATDRRYRTASAPAGARAAVAAQGAG